MNHIHHPGYKFVFGDMTDGLKIEKLIVGFDVVILLAGLVGDPITKTYPKVAGLINDEGVKNVIDLCAKKNIEKFIFISTCSNYGLIEKDELAHENFDLKPLSLYAKSKVNAEKYILSLREKQTCIPLFYVLPRHLGCRPGCDLT